MPISAERKPQLRPEEGPRFEEESAVLFEELKEMPAVAEALALLDRLPEHLRYHDKGHTLDVIRETILFALADGVERGVIEQQAISAAWHDVGYIKQDKENEPIAIDLFKQSEAYKHLPEEIREEIIANIADTTPIMRDGKPFLLMQHSAFGYALDGDVSNFGRKDFFEKRMKVAEELGLDLANPEIKKKFYAFTVGLLENHEWKTDSARLLRQAQKDENLKIARAEFAELETSPTHD